MDGTRQRVLFNADVFRFISLWVGIRWTGLLKIYEGVFVVYFWWVVLGLGAIFYILSLLFFRMYRGNSLFKDISAKIALWCVLLVVLIIGSAHIWWDIGTSLKQTWWNITTWTNWLIVSTKNITHLEEEKIGEKKSVVFSWEAVSWDLEDIEATSEIKEHIGKKRLFDHLSLDSQTTLTFGNFLPLLVEKYSLPKSEHIYNFTYVGKDNDLYVPFSIARDYNMIGNATRPDQKILCKHLMVLLWLAEERELSYNAHNIFEVFWKEAEKRWYTDYGCEDLDQVATVANLP